MIHHRDTETSQRHTELSDVFSMKKVSSLVCLLLLVSIPALAQSPHTAEEFNNRGLQRLSQSDFDGAIEDFTAAIARGGQPILMGAVYYNRANARMGKVDW